MPDIPWPVSDARLAPLLEPMTSLLGDAAARLPVQTRPALRAGPVEGFWALVDGDLVLSEALLGDSPHPDEVEGRRALDRWRRALSSVLEGSVAASLGPGEGPDWARLGLCVHAADEAAPGIGLAAPDLAAARQGDFGACPRAGVAVLRAWAREGHDPWTRGFTAWQQGVAMADLLGAARRVLSAEGVGDVADVARPVPVDVPATLSPWTMARVEVASHPRGGRIVVQGDGACEPSWAEAGQALRGLAVSGTAGCQLVPSAGGPVGTWELRTAEGWGRVMGARGTVFVLRASGAVEVVLADAFVGGAAELSVAERMGSSGTASARWRVAGPQQIAFADVRTDGVTIHGRGGPSPAFAVPGISGVSAGLHALSEAPWDWRMREDGRLVLDGRISGGPISLVLSQPDVDA